MFRELIPRLANDYRVIAPDLPGFGFTEVPAPSGARMILFSFLRAQKRFKRNLPHAIVQFLDTGRFATETHVIEIVAAMREFLAANGRGRPSAKGRVAR